MSIVEHFPGGETDDDNTDREQQRSDVGEAGIGASHVAAPPARPSEAPIQAKTKNQNIRVSPAVLNAARKDGEQLLRDRELLLRETPKGCAGDLILNLLTAREGVVKQENTHVRTIF